MHRQYLPVGCQQMLWRSAVVSTLVQAEAVIQSARPDCLQPSQGLIAPHSNGMMPDAADQWWVASAHLARLDCL